MTFDTHLINETLAALGITVGIAVLMAVLITAIAATQLRHRPTGRGKLTTVPSQHGSVQAPRERERQAA